jgi:hypothetical protein
MYMLQHSARYMQEGRSKKEKKWQNDEAKKEAKRRIRPTRRRREAEQGGWHGEVYTHQGTQKGPQQAGRDWTRLRAARSWRTHRKVQAKATNRLDTILLKDLPIDGRLNIAKKAFAYEIRRHGRWWSRNEEFEGLARMASAPRHLGKRSAETVLALCHTLRKRSNGELLDEVQWLEYTGLKDRQALLEKGCQVLECDWKRAVTQAAKEQQAGSDRGFWAGKASKKKPGSTRQKPGIFHRSKKARKKDADLGALLRGSSELISK